MIEHEEEHFWIDVIDKYLSPLTLDPKEQERIRLALIELRNKVGDPLEVVNCGVQAPFRSGGLDVLHGERRVHHCDPGASTAKRLPSY